MKMPRRPGRKSNSFPPVAQEAAPAGPRFHINPRYRAYGKARLDIARRVQTQADWDSLWKPPANPFPFSFGGAWKQSIEYKVDDFAAEVGFYIDILGLPVNAFGPNYAQFTGPQGDYFFAVTPAPPDEDSTPPEAIRIQFYLEGLLETVHLLERRGVTFELKPQPAGPGSTLYVASFRTPHGISIDLLGEVTSRLRRAPETASPGLPFLDIGAPAQEPAPENTLMEQPPVKTSGLPGPEADRVNILPSAAGEPEAAQAETNLPGSSRKRSSRRASRKEKPALPADTPVEAPPEPETAGLITESPASSAPPRQVTPWDFLESNQEEIPPEASQPLELAGAAEPQDLREAAPEESHAQKNALDTNREPTPGEAPFPWLATRRPELEEKKARPGADFSGLEEGEEILPETSGFRFEEPASPDFLEDENDQQPKPPKKEGLDETEPGEEAPETGIKDEEPVYEDIAYEDLDEEQLYLFEEASTEDEDSHPRTNGRESHPKPKDPFPHRRPHS